MRPGLDIGDNESGTIKDATQQLDLEMTLTDARTDGEFLHTRRADGQSLLCLLRSAPSF